MDRRFLRLAIKFPWLFGLAIICAEIAAIVLVFQLKLIAYLFNGLVFTGLPKSSLLKLIPILILLVGVRALMILAENLASGRLAILVKSRLRFSLSQKLIQMENRGGHSSAEIQSIFLDDVESVDAYFSQYLPQVILSVLVPVTFLLFVFPLDLLSAIIFLVTIPLIPVFMVLIGKAAEERNKRQFSKLHQMSTFFLDSIQGIKSLILMNQIDRHEKRIRTASNEYRKATLDVLRISFLSAFSLELISTISTAVIAVQIGLRLLYGRMDFESAFLVLLVAPEIYLPLRNLGTRFHAAMNGVSAAQTIFSVLTEDPIAIAPAEIKTAYLSRCDLLRFVDVSLQYPGGNYALNGFNAEFRLGSRNAIVGPSGAGKSTIFQLILKFIKPSDGAVFLDNDNLENLDVPFWRNQIAWLPQLPLLLTKSIRQNLLIAQPEATEENLFQVLADVGLLDLINSLPQRLDTSFHEYGRGLSSGERQRLGLARVLLRNAKLILLDEPTSALDTLSEKIVLETLDRLAPSTTILTIAHRLHSVHAADSVYFLKEGKLSGAGNHHDLLKSNQDYSHFCQAYFGQMT